MPHKISSSTTNTTRYISANQKTSESHQFNEEINHWKAKAPEKRTSTATYIKKAYENNLTQMEIYAPDLDELPDAIGKLVFLERLYLNNCTGIKALPESIKQLVNLERFAPGSGLLLIPENVINLPALRVVSLFDAHNLIFKPAFPARENGTRVDVQGGSNIPDFSAFVSNGNINDFDFTNKEDIEKFQAIVDYTATSNEAINSQEFIKQLLEKAKTFPGNLNLDHLNLCLSPGFNEEINHWEAKAPEKRTSTATYIKKAYENNLTQMEIYAPDLDELPDAIGKLVFLERLYLNNCTGIKALPESIKQLVNLERFAPGSGLLLIPESIINLPALRVVSLFDAHNLIFKPAFPARENGTRVDVQGGNHIPDFSAFVSAGKINAFDFTKKEDIEKFQAIVDYAATSTKAINNNEFIKQLLEKAKTFPGNLENLKQRLELSTISETQKLATKSDPVLAPLSRLPIKEQHESQVTAFITSLKGQTDEKKIIKLLSDRGVLQTMFNNASLEELPTLIKTIIDSKLSESSKKDFLETYPFKNENEKTKYSIFCQEILSSDLDEITKAWLLPDSAIAMEIKEALSDFQLHAPDYDFDEIRKTRELIETALNELPRSQITSDVFFVKVFVEAGELILKRNIEYCENTKDIKTFIEKFRDPRQHQAPQAHIIASSGGHRYLLDLQRHHDKKITAMVIDAVGFDPNAPGSHHESYDQYQEYKSSFNKIAFISTWMQVGNEGCTLFALSFALSAYRNKEHFQQLHQQLLAGQRLQRQDLPISMFRHIQSSKAITALKTAGVKTEEFASRRELFEKEDGKNSLSYLRADYKWAALQYLNALLEEL